VLCNFGETDYLGTQKGPRMLLLDSLKTDNLTWLRTSINRFDSLFFPFLGLENYYKHDDLADNMFSFIL
jgi:hypothetical protein